MNQSTESNTTQNQPLLIEDIKLNMHGIHNVLNATATIALASDLNVPLEVIKQALASFSGVQRRFTYVGDYSGVSIYDDYAHHPTEIAAVIAAAKKVTSGKLAVLVQPHRYTRLKEHFDDFVNTLTQCDYIGILPVYSAKEDPNGYDSERLLQRLLQVGCKNASLIKVEEVDDYIKSLTASVLGTEKAPKILVAMGAGDISYIIRETVNKLIE